MTGPVRSWDDATAEASQDAELAGAVASFRRLLGEKWRGWANDSPLACVFWTAFQDGPREGVRLHRLVRDLDGVPNVGLFVAQGLGSAAWCPFEAGVATLEFCAGFHRACRPVELIQNDHHKSPDARVDLAGRWVTIELKSLHEPDERKPWDDLFNYVCQAMWNRGTNPHSLDIEYYPAALHAPEALVAGLLAVKEARRPEFQELPEGTGRARFVAEWGNEWQCLPPVAQVNDLVRLVRNLTEKWWRQLEGASGPTLLVVRTRMLFGTDLEDIKVKATLAGTLLGAMLLARTMVSAMLVYDELPGTVSSPVLDEKGVFCLAIGPSDGGHARAACSGWPLPHFEGLPQVVGEESIAHEVAEVRHGERVSVVWPQGWRSSVGIT